jgi:hypothetical protein
MFASTGWFCPKAAGAAVTNARASTAATIIDFFNAVPPTNRWSTFLNRRGYTSPDI